MAGFKSLADMRKGNSLQSLIDQADKMSKSTFEADERFWQPTVDKVGNGSAIIRFLPPKQGEEVPFVRIWSHGFKGRTGQWYIENSLTTLQQEDPVAELNSRLWNSGNESDKAIARNQKRKLSYISNILVIKDSANPQNEGKVFLYKYGAKIFEKIKDSLNPQFEDQDALNPFDFWQGANFRLRIRNKDSFRNYDDSTFDSPSPISQDDEVIESIWNMQHSLNAEIAPDKFKTYAELKLRLDKVLGGNSAPKLQDRQEDAPVVREEAAPTMKTTATKSSPMDDEEDDDAESYFAGLAAAGK